MALKTGVNIHFKTYENTVKSAILNCNNVSQYYCFYCNFDQKRIKKNNIYQPKPLINYWKCKFGSVLF